MTALSEDMAAALKRRIEELEQQLKSSAAENARLAVDQRQALERQAATADILKVIAASPSDARPVFEAIASSSKYRDAARRVHRIHDPVAAKEQLSRLRQGFALTAVSRPGG